jgi:hypothetical protein
MAQVIETVFSIRTEESVANLNEVVNSLGRTEAAAKKTTKSISDEVAKIPAATKRAASGFNGLSNSINQVSRELPAFAFSAQTGFLAISNNIPILIDEITALRKANAALTASGKEAVPIWKQVASSLFSWQTAMSVGISLSVLYAKEIGGFISALFKGKEAIDAAKISLNALNGAYKSDAVKDNVQDLLQLRINLGLASKGYISKKGVLKEYNESIGITEGKTNDVKVAEQKLIDLTPKLIEAYVYRAAAQKILSDSITNLIEVQRNQNELDTAEAEKKKVQAELNALAPTAENEMLKKSKLIRIAELRYVISQSKEKLKVAKDAYDTEYNLAVQFSEKASKVLGTGLGDSGKGGGATEKIKTAFELLQEQIAELQKKIENGIYTDKNVTKDVALLAKLEQKVKDVEKAFSVLTGEDAELNFQAAIKDSEAFLTEVGKQADDDLKDRRRADKKAIEDRLLDDKEYFLRLKEEAGDNQKDLDFINELEILANIRTYKFALAAGEDYGKKLLEEEEKLRLLRLGITTKGAKERADLEKQILIKGLDIASGVSGQYFDLKSNQLKAETDLEVKNLEEMRDKKLITEEQFKTKSAEIKNEAARKQREYDLAQIQVNTALAIIKALATAPTILAGVALASLALIEGGIQYAFASSQPLPQFAKGTERVTGGVAGKDSVHALLMPNEAVIPAKANMERQGLAKAWISGDLDKHLAMNYINPAINEVNRKWETSLRLNQQSTFIRNDNFSDKKIVGELVKSNRLNRALINSLSEGKTARRNKRIWN